MIVDDDPAVAGTVADMIRSRGHFPVVAWDKQSALSIWRETNQAFDIVIIDYLLGPISGAGLAVTLGKEKPEVQFVLMSGLSEEQVDAPPGRVNFLAKPFTIETLGKRINAVLENKS